MKGYVLDLMDQQSNVIYSESFSKGEKDMKEFVDLLEDMSVMIAECDSEEEFRNRRDELFEDHPWLFDG